MVCENYFREMLTDNLEEADLVVSGFAYEGGCSCGLGTKLAPQKLLELSSFLPCTTKDGFKIQNFKIFNNGVIEGSDHTFLEEAKSIANLSFSTDKFSLFVGGDHSIAIATEAAFYDYAKSLGKRACIIHLDAHPDYCDFYDGSKLSHACPNARAIDYGFGYEDITLIGIRGFEEQEVDLFSEHKEIPLYTATFIKNGGIDKMIDEICSRYNDALVHISFDIDITDPSFAPGTGTPESFGLSSDEVLYILTNLFRRLNVISMDLVEVSPASDVNDVTTWLALKTLYELFYVLKGKK